MIKGVVDFALENRFLILAVALLLFVWGPISFHNLPVDAYPDVADNYVNVITQWPGQISKTCKEVNGKLIDNPDVVEGAVLLQKGADADPALNRVEVKGHRGPIRKNRLQLLSLAGWSPALC
jgi:hypothetical protein